MFRDRSQLSAWKHNVKVGNTFIERRKEKSQIILIQVSSTAMRVLGFQFRPLLNAHHMKNPLPSGQEGLHSPPKQSVNFHSVLSTTNTTNCCFGRDEQPQRTQIWHETPRYAK